MRRLHTISARWMLLSLATALACIGETKQSTRADEQKLPAGWRRITSDGAFKQHLNWSPDGKRLIFSRFTDDSVFTFVCQSDGSEEHRLLEGDAFHFGTAFSPDGKRIAYAFDTLSPGQGDMQIHVADADGKNPQPLFASEGKLSHEEWPSWSPDGKWIVCQSTRDENEELYLIYAGQDEEAPSDDQSPRRLTSDPALDMHPAFSPDGKRIAFATNRWGDFELVIFDLKSAGVTRLTESPGLDDYPAWSPDGQQIAFTSQRDGNLEIYVMNADGSQPRNVTRHAGPDNFASWTPAGDITFVSFFDGQWDIFSLTP